MSTHNFLAFDLGAESGRAILGSLASDRLTLQEKHRFPNPTGRMFGHLHWNLLAQWEHLKTGLRNATAGGLPLSGIGVDTWGVDFGLVAPGGQILGYPYCYRDSRTNGMLEKTFRSLSRDKIFQSTGIQFMQFNSLYQLLAMYQLEPAVVDSAETLLFIPDLFNYLFTGIRKCESSIASTSQMYDPRDKSWAVPMLQQLGLPTKILPDIIPSGTILGPLSSDIQSECFLGPIPVIAPACHDTASAVAAVPADGSDWCYISSGTWSLMGVELDFPIINDKYLKYNYTNEVGVNNTIRFLKNIMGLWLVQECRRQFHKDGREYSYAELTQAAADSPPHRSLIDPDHSPFLAPGDMPSKIQDFCRRTRQPIPESPGQLIRTCLDSLALTYRKTLAGLEDVLARPIKTIHIVGGGTQNQLLNQMTADACARPVIAGPIEATAIGNLLVQAMATGNVRSLSHARQIIRESFPVIPYHPRDTEQWDHAYSRYQSLRC